jgi:Cu(I)/Ag(I) efflux system protein CusF
LGAVLGLALAISPAIHAAEMPGRKSEGQSAAVTTGQTRGVIKSLDAAKGTVTIAHEAVAALKWPAMTMAFAITPEQARGIEVGQKVDFEFSATSKAATITRIAPVR